MPPRMIWGAGRAVGRGRVRGSQLQASRALPLLQLPAASVSKPGRLKAPPAHKVHGIDANGHRLDEHLSMQGRQARGGEWAGAPPSALDRQAAAAAEPGRRSCCRRAAAAGPARSSNTGGGGWLAHQTSTAPRLDRATHLARLARRQGHVDVLQHLGPAALADLHSLHHGACCRREAREGDGMRGSPDHGGWMTSWAAGGERRLPASGGTAAAAAAVPAIAPAVGSAASRFLETQRSWGWRAARQAQCVRLAQGPLSPAGRKASRENAWMDEGNRSECGGVNARPERQPADELAATLQRAPPPPPPVAGQAALVVH